jgi:hypothetical protein
MPCYTDVPYTNMPTTIVPHAGVWPEARAANAVLLALRQRARALLRRRLGRGVAGGSHWRRWPQCRVPRIRCVFGSPRHHHALVGRSVDWLVGEGPLVCLSYRTQLPPRQHRDTSTITTQTLAWRAHCSATTRWHHARAFSRKRPTLLHTCPYRSAPASANEMVSVPLHRRAAVPHGVARVGQLPGASSAHLHSCRLRRVCLSSFGR